jgi:hypothetical protein
MAQGQIFQHEMLARLEPGKEVAEDRQNQMEHGSTIWLTVPKNQSSRPLRSFRYPQCSKNRSAVRTRSAASARLSQPFATAMG